MTQDDEYKKRREDLEAILVSKKLQWIVDHSNEKILLNKTVMKKVDSQDTSTEILSGKRIRGGRKKLAEFLSTEEFSEEEKFFILVDSIEMVFEKLYAMQKGVFANLESIQSISFRPEIATHAAHMFGQEELLAAERTAERFAQIRFPDLGV